MAYFCTLVISRFQSRFYYLGVHGKGYGCLHVGEHVGGLVYHQRYTQHQRVKQNNNLRIETDLMQTFVK